MPQHAPPKTLKNLAFENIIKHVDSVWTSQYVKDWGNKHLLYVEGPFDILTPAGEYIQMNELVFLLQLPNLERSIPFLANYD